MIDAKHAYSHALEHFKDLVGDYECDLEEIELSDNAKFWIVTFSYYEKKPRTDTTSSIKILKKFAKTISIFSANGSFFSMKNAKL